MARNTNNRQFLGAAEKSIGKPHVFPMAARKRKPRNTALPAVPTEVQTPYALCRDEFAGLSVGELTLIILKSQAWQTVIVPKLAALDAERSVKGPKPSYTSEELEAAVLFQKLAGVATYGQARAILAGDREHRTREALNFDKPRKRYGRGVVLVRSLDGVPSEATIWRHMQRWGLDRHNDAYEAMLDQLVPEHLQDPEFQAEARVLNIDGSTIRSHYTSWERLNRKTGEIKPPTLHGGGFMARHEGNPGSDGHGFTMVAVTTSTGLPLACRLVPLAEKDQMEPETALALFKEDWAEKVKPHLGPGLAVLTADSAYKAQPLRTQLHDLGIVEVCHKTSHAWRGTSLEAAEKENNAVWEIQGYPSWRANGHRELYCLCGEGKTIQRFSQDKNGKAVIRTEGQCKTCGSITITAGKWRKARNPTRFVRILAGEGTHELDASFGNPLTFNDKTAKAFGRARFGHNEGFHGHLQTRFGLLKHKARYRKREQAKLDCLMIFCSMHVLAMEQRKRARATASASPPGIAVAA
jgi:hypothetical protein